MNKQASVLVASWGPTVAPNIKTSGRPPRRMVDKAVKDIVELLDAAGITLEERQKARHLDDLRNLEEDDWKEVLWHAGDGWFLDVDEEGGQTEDSFQMQMQFESAVMDELRKQGVL